MTTPDNPLINSACGRDVQYAAAVQLAEKKASVSYLQRNLLISYHHAEDLLERIFELGVSDPTSPTPLGEGEHRGQGLFVAKTYMAKMGGTINARNTEGGVAFVLTFQRLG